MRSLPIIVGSSNKYQWGVASLFFFVGLYALTNAMHWRPPTVLTPGRLDEAIPLVPGTVWIYTSYILISLSAYVLERQRETLSRFVYAQFAANIASALIFFIWPTTFLRPELTGGDPVSHAALQLVWLIDEPVNCFPSLHVSSSFLAALMMSRRPGIARIVFSVWAVAIAISTMTTKQHHSIDVLGGTLLAVGLYWFFFYRVTLRAQPSKVSIQA